MKCKNCGKEFKPIREDHHEKRALTDSRGKNRAFTDITPYLCQKWQREGMPISQIADMLNRSIQNIKKALAVPLTKDAYQDMREYAK